MSTGTVVALLLLAAIMIPVPHALYPSFGIHCPYIAIAIYLERLPSIRY
jgi:hypothetical protein